MTHAELHRQYQAIRADIVTAAREDWQPRRTIARLLVDGGDLLDDARDAGVIGDDEAGCLWVALADYAASVTRELVPEGAH